MIVDAHAGVGTFGLALSGRATRVLAFEPHGGALASGRWTASLSNISNVEFRQGRAETLLQRLRRDEQPDLILLDPPRAGCHPDLLSEIQRRRIPKIVYVSCDPSTLARDIKALSANYALTSARVVDMFPQTFHLESVAVLAAGGAQT
jgi:23S rRNA (uracil1939-C5)-methyltransferase